METSYSLKEAKNEWLRKNNQLQLYLGKKNIEFIKTGPKTIEFKTIIVSGGQPLDRFTHYLFKCEEYDSIILSLQQEINLIEKFMYEEFERMLKHDEIGLICYLKEDESWKWENIDKALYKSPGGSKLKYNRFKKYKIDTV